MRSPLGTCLVSSIVLAVAWSCVSTPPPQPPTSLSPQSNKKVVAAGDLHATYPDLAALYAGEQGIYRTCGPTSGVCHNAKEFPNLASLGSIAGNVNALCNQKREVPSEVHDLCERHGDMLRYGERHVEIGSLREVTVTARAGQVSRIWSLTLREPLVKVAPDESYSIERMTPSGLLTMMTLDGITIVTSPEDSTGKTLRLQLPAPKSGSDDPGDAIAARFAKAGIASDSTSIQLGDANGNGVFGADLQGRLVRPGHPEKSYLLTRLTDATAGPLMPRANCCSWSKSSLRALWCWVAGLRDDGQNILQPIDYASCPPGPVENVEYPALGPQCEKSGMCPVHARTEAVDAPGSQDFASLYANIFHVKCSGGNCHVDHAVGGVDFKNQSVAYQSLRTRVVAGRPEDSELFRRISPSVCAAPACELMPMGAPPLSADERASVFNWIERGASE